MRKNRETQFKADLNTLRLVMDNIPSLVFWKDINSNFLGCNKKFALVFGFKSLKSIIGKSTRDLISLGDAQKLIDMDEEIFSTGLPKLNVIEHITLPDNKKVWIKIDKMPLYNSKKKLIGLVGLMEDITAQITLEEKIKHNSEIYQGLIEATNTAYIIMDEELNIKECNGKFVEIIKGKTPQDVLNNNLRIWVNGADIKEFDAAIENLRKGKSINELEIKILTKNNDTVSIILCANIIENGSRKIFCLLRDISNRKQVEEKRFILREKTKDRIKQEITEMRKELRKLRVG